MTSTMRSTTAREQVVTRHPIRGAIWGFLLGVSVAIYMVLFAVIPFGDWIPLGLCVLGGIAVGVLWAFVAPPKRPKEDGAVVVADERTATVADDGDGGDVDADDGDGGDGGGGDGGGGDGGGGDGGGGDGGDGGD